MVTIRLILRVVCVCVCVCVCLSVCVSRRYIVAKRLKTAMTVIDARLVTCRGQLLCTEYGSDAPTERETEGGILDLENC